MEIEIITINITGLTVENSSRSVIQMILGSVSGNRCKLTGRGEENAIE